MVARVARCTVADVYGRVIRERPLINSSPEWGGITEPTSQEVGKSSLWKRAPEGATQTAIGVRTAALYAFKKETRPKKSGRAQNLLSLALLHTAQIAVVVHDVSMALVVVVEFRVVPASVAGLAAGVEIVAFCLDLFARLHVRTVGAVDGRVSARTAVSAGCDTAKVAVIVDDLPMAFPVVVEARLVPVAISCLTARFQIVAVALDVLAGARVSIAGYARGISALICSRSAIAIACARDALQVAVIIQDISVAFVVVIELGLMPASVAPLAACMQVVAANMHVLARLHVRSVGAVSCLISAGAIARRSAAERSIIVADITVAALRVR